MAIFLSPQAWLGAGLIFLLRVGDMSLDTTRMLVVMRGRKRLAWVLGFFQSMIYVVAISSVLAHLDNPLNILGYAAGFATGNVFGMWLEDRMALGHIYLTVVSPALGTAVAERLRQEGYAITEIPARGRSGTVTVLHCNVHRRDVDKVQHLVEQADASAFITAQDVRTVRRGFWRS
jgi:uncharacterized protein YebE (UPF0316 family)